MLLFLLFFHHPRQHYYIEVLNDRYMFAGTCCLRTRPMFWSYVLAQERVLLLSHYHLGTVLALERCTLVEELTAFYPPLPDFRCLIGLSLVLRVFFTVVFLVRKGTLTGPRVALGWIVIFQREAL